MPCSWIVEHSIVKALKPPKSFYTCDIIPVKAPTEFLLKLETLSLKFLEESKYGQKILDTDK